MKQAEHHEQAALFQWAELAAGKRPELRLLFAVPNGGAMHIAVARKLKAEGVKAGVPDVFLPVGRGGFYGLFVEMKAGKNKPTAQQWYWHEALTLAKYRVCVCHGFDEARQKIEDYLDMDNPNPMPK